VCRTFARRMPQSRLCERLGILKPVMVAVLRDLEEQGLVQRQPHPTDRRARIVSLLPAGRRRLKVVEKANRRAADEFFSPLTRQERLTFHDLLAKLVGPTTTEE
jgi:MarR family transcriptional regulator, lower aerobic nicotinate degradation pathway regulator